MRLAPVAVATLSVAWFPGAARGAEPVRPGILRDAASAVRRYRAVHRSTIAPRLKDADRRAADGLVARRPSARRTGCRTARACVVAPGEPTALYGSLAALDRDGECWVLRWDGLLDVGLGAVLSRDGEVLLAWWIPEG